MPTTLVALSLRVTGGHVVFGIPASYGHGMSVLRELRLGTKVTATLSSLRGWLGSASFDAHDEVLAWIDTFAAAHIAPNSAFVDRPRYLGNALGSSSFAPNRHRWIVEFPVSKALPVCGVTVRRGTTIVRSLGCATTTGSAATSWDGRDAAGRPVAKGRYTWTFNGRDTDGWLLWWNGANRPITGTVTVS